MKFRDAIDLYVIEQRRLGRINSNGTEDSYRSRLLCHAEDVDNRDPSKTGRDDVKKTLNRWPHPNTQRHAHAVLTSFYDWACEEGIRETNPGRQVRKARKRATSVYRLTRDEVVRVMDAAKSPRERWVIYLGFCAGARNQELRGLQPRHFARPGYVHFSKDIAKGGKEAWIPVIDELAPIIDEILETLETGEFVVCARRPANPPLNTRWTERRKEPASPQAVWRLVGDVAKRAGISEHIHPHLLRHAFGDHIAKQAGLRAAQGLLRHSSVETTADTYVDRPSLDELAVSIHGFSYRKLSPQTGAPIPQEATTGIEPV